MSKRRFNVKNIERTLGGLKFAVVLISLFAVLMIIGTFLESYYGTEFASRAIYKKFPFMALQFGMAISIIFAAFLRLPPKKRLYGFYGIHSGLIMIGCGAFITYYAGIDGHISLYPNEPNRTVILNDDVLVIEYPDEGKTVTRKLPYTAFKTSLDDQYEDLEFKEYYPFSENTLKWLPSDSKNPEATHSASYLIYNDNVSQNFLLSLHPKAVHAKSTLSMGPLNVHYLPSPLADCFDINNGSKVILYNAKEQSCFTPESRDVSFQKTSQGSRFFVLKDEGSGELLSFFPDFSPWPVNEKLQVVRDAGYRSFSKKLFEQKPHLFLFGENLAYFDKENERWVVESFKENESIIPLPWMNFKVRLTRFESDKYPYKKPEYTLPIQKNGKLIKGGMKALAVLAQGEKYWVTDDRPLGLMIDGKRVNLKLQKEVLTLPFQLNLERFKMDKNPGTNSPASYESFVQLFGQNGTSRHHIFMNNPLKKSGFTFYQASYSPLGGDNYSSTLSVNVDPGRFLKYLGSVFLVVGSMAHYYLNKSRFRIKKKRKNKSTADTKDVSNSDSSAGVTT